MSQKEGGTFKLEKWDWRYYTERLRKARSFRTNILERRGSEDAMVLYKRFRGAEPSVEPLLARRGLK